MTYTDVIAKFSSRNKNMTIDKYDIIDWVNECVRGIGNLDNCVFFKGVELTVTNKTALLPCNFYKLDYLFKNGAAFSLSGDGDFRVSGDKRINFDDDYIFGDPLRMWNILDLKSAPLIFSGMKKI